MALRRNNYEDTELFIKNPKKQNYKISHGLSIFNGIQFYSEYLYILGLKQNKNHCYPYLDQGKVSVKRDKGV
jgi:hypothetical protein